MRDVELEAQPRMGVEPAGDRGERRRLAEAERVHEPDGPRLAAHGLVQRHAGLAQREVQRRRLERPVAPAPHRLPLGRLLPLLDAVHVLAERRERPLARHRQHRPHRVQRDGLVAERGDVLAEALLTTALEADQRRHALEVVAHRRSQPLDLVGLDLQREVCEGIPGRHAADTIRASCAGRRTTISPSACSSSQAMSAASKPSTPSVSAATTILSKRSCSISSRSACR